MRIIVVFPSVEEATAFLLTEPRVPVFVAGSDPAEMAAATVRAIRAKKPHLAILAGLAVSCDGRVEAGATVEVVASRMADAAREYSATGPETGLPEVGSVTLCGAERACRETGAANACAEEPNRLPPDTSAAAVQPCGTASGGAAPFSAEPPRDSSGLPEVVFPSAAEPGRALPLVAEREGAAFFAVCEAMETACCQVRAVTRRLAEEPDEPVRRAALRSLTKTLVEILTQITENHE